MDAISLPLTIPAALDRAARMWPDNVAYVQGSASGSGSVTWGELARRAGATAAGLIAQGLQRGDRVAISAENSIDWMEAAHAVAAAGGVSVPVYFDLAAGEIAEQVRRPGSRFLFASSSVVEKLSKETLGVEKTFLLGEAAAGPGQPLRSIAATRDDASLELMRIRAPAADDPALIVYTSGTTGGAKGVVLSQRNLVANGRSVVEAIDFSDRDSSLLVLPLHHALPFLATVVVPPLVGAKIVIENDLRRIRDRLQQHRPTIFFGVPALYDLVYRNILARAETEGRLERLQKALGVARRVKQASGVNIGQLLFRPVHSALGGRLRFLVSGGAALNPATATNFFELGLPLLQGWGMTEAAPVIAVQRFSSRRFRFTRFYEQHAGSVGPAVPGVEMRLIDVPDKDIRVAAGGEGEAIVRGPNVFQGYWQADELTAETKLDGWLRTGDLARIDRDGNIYLTGRSKYVIVLDSGEKVHPDEIEQKLADGETIEDVCITGRSSRGKVQVTAVVYPRLEGLREQALTAGVELSAASLERLVSDEVQRLTRDIAAYKRISRIELTDTPLPKTVLRKVARGRLDDAYGFDFQRWLETAEAAG